VDIFATFFKEKIQKFSKSFLNFANLNRDYNKNWKIKNLL